MLNMFTFTPAVICSLVLYFQLVVICQTRDQCSCNHQLALTELSTDVLQSKSLLGQKLNPDTTQGNGVSDQKSEQPVGEAEKPQPQEASAPQTSSSPSLSEQMVNVAQVSLRYLYLTAVFSEFMCTFAWMKLASLGSA